MTDIAPHGLHHVTAIASDPVTVLSHQGGHTVDPHQLPRLAAFLAEGARHG